MTQRVSSHFTKQEFFLNIGAVCNALEDIVVRCIEKSKNAIALNFTKHHTEKIKLPSCLPDRIKRSFTHLPINTYFPDNHNYNHQLHWLIKQCENLKALDFDCACNRDPYY